MFSFLFFNAVRTEIGNYLIMVFALDSGYGGQSDCRAWIFPPSKLNVSDLDSAGCLKLKYAVIQQILKASV